MRFRGHPLPGRRHWWRTFEGCAQGVVQHLPCRRDVDRIMRVGLDRELYAADPKLPDPATHPLSYIVDHRRNSFFTVEHRRAKHGNYVDKSCGELSTYGSSKLTVGGSKGHGKLGFFGPILGKNS